MCITNINYLLTPQPIIGYHFNGFASVILIIKTKSGQVLMASTIFIGDTEYYKDGYVDNKVCSIHM